MYIRIVQEGSTTDVPLFCRRVDLAEQVAPVRVENPSNRDDGGESRVDRLGIRSGGAVLRQTRQLCVFQLGLLV